jgi:DNA mismatch repair protein PMS2
MNTIDAHSVHQITAGQVVIDLQTAVKELVENSLDAGATSIGTSLPGPSTALHSVPEVRFHSHGLKTIEIVDNGSGIAPTDHDSIGPSIVLCQASIDSVTALKHHTSKLASFEDLSRVLTFGFRGEALSSLCALTDGFIVTTATSSEAPMGTVIEMDRNGKARSKCKIARQVCHPVRPPTVSLTHHREERRSRSRTYSSHSLCAAKSLRETRSANFKRH